MISYTITVCNEAVELDLLLHNLTTWGNISSDEIVVQMDSNNVTQEVKDVISKYSDYHNLVVVEFPFNGDFSEFKNNIHKFCSQKWIFNIDADETPTQDFIKVLPDILGANDSTDMILVPRANTVDGITQEHINKWRWNVNADGLINWPDLQTRIYKNPNANTDVKCHWEGKVHERLVGYTSYASLPTESTPLYLVHKKNIDRQERQNRLYDMIGKS